MKDFNISLFSKTMLVGATMLLTSVGSVHASSAMSESAEKNHVAAPQQSKIKVTGVVEDQFGPVVGANVVEKGTTNGTITDADGKFSLDVVSNATLVFTYIGYAEQQIPVSGKTSFNVLLKEDALALEEVVVTVGFGQQKKVNLTGAISSVNFEEQAMSRPLTNVSTALAGMSAGVQVMQTSGKPGSDGASIRIRGIGTLNNSDPLVLIDGIEGIMDAVNPQDIENISILKDAAASAIYGSRAANGVILITTKRGKKGSLSVNYSGRVSFQEPANLIDQVTDYARYMDLVNEAFNNIGQKDHFAQSTIELWREKAKDPNGLNENGVPNYMAYPNTDWQEALFGDGVLNDHNVSVSGGSDKIRFLTSAGYLDNPGLVENVGIKRYSLRANIEANVTDWLTVGTRTFASQEDSDQGNFDSANNYLRQTTPGVYPRHDGKYGYPEAPEESGTANNIFAMLNGSEGTKKKTRFNTTLFSKVEFLKGLTWDFNFNYKRRWDENKSWSNAIEKVKFSDGTIMSPATDPSQMTTYFYNYGNYEYTIQNLLNYTTTIANDHDIAALAGYEEVYYYESSNNATKKGLIDQSVNTPSSATEMVSIGGSAQDRASRSFFGRINYAYKSKYLFEANIRRDGHSRYHKDYRWGTFPSFSAAWRISEEGFMEKTRDWLDNLKLRASYGKIGNNGGDNVGNYEYQSTYGITRYSIGGLLQAGLSSTSIANSMLTWESSATTNIGLDLTALNNRLTFEADVFNKNTTGILFQPSIYLTAGSKTAPRLNIAEMNSSGVELTLGWKDKIKDFSYSVSANFSYLGNKVEKYKGTLQEGWTTDAAGNQVWKTNIGDVSSGGSTPIVEGKRSKEYYMKSTYSGTGRGYDADGINGGPKDGMIRTEQDMDWLNKMIAEGYTFMPNKTVGKNKIWYGDYVYADANGDGIYGSSYDNEFQGVSRDPKYVFGMQMSGAYKNFDISLNWAGAAGYKVYWGATTGLNSPSVRTGVAIPTEIANDHYFYDPANPSDARTNLNATYGRLVAAESGYQNSEASTLYLFNGNFLKLKNITIGYTLPRNIAQKIYTKSLRVYVSGENLLNFNSFPGQDPELNSSSAYTSIKQYAIGVNISF